MRHQVTRVLPYSPDQLFELVSDVRRYPEFVPWITSMRVEDGGRGADGASVVRAEAGVGFSFLRERFTTEVTSHPPDRRIAVRLLSGPFRRLENHWGFAPDSAGCRVSFDIDFEFKSRLLAALLRANFGLAVDRLIGCFEARARALYGSRSIDAATLSRFAPEEASARS